MDVFMDASLFTWVFWGMCLVVGFGLGWLDHKVRGHYDGFN